MEENKKYNISESVYNPQLKALLFIRDFGLGLEVYKNKVLAATRLLIQTYEKGESFLNQESDQDYEKEWEELLNEIRVHANQLNHHLMLAKEKVESNTDFQFKNLWKEFEARSKELQIASQKLENLGAKVLPKEHKERWGNDFSIFEKDILPEIRLHAKAIEMIIEFMTKYDVQQLEKISNIIIETIPEGATFKDTKEYEAAYLKSLREFQKEFRKEKNLWDTILEILAGGVHPSPSERVMLEKWMDGEEKIREDM